MNRRELIRGIGRALCAGLTVPYIPALLADPISSVSPGFNFGMRGQQYGFINQNGDYFPGDFDVYLNKKLLKRGTDYIYESASQIIMKRVVVVGDDIAVKARKKMINPKVDVQVMLGD